MKISKVITNNMGLKAIALMLALVTWVYVGEAAKIDGEKTALRRLLSPSDYIAKKLIIKPIFVAGVPVGYEFLANEVKVMPDSIVVVGPSKILSSKEFIYTNPIDLTEHTKTKTIEIGLEDISRSIQFDQTEVQVHLPVRKLSVKTSKEE